MSRHKGCLSSATAKEIARELEQLGGKSYRYNFDYLRLIEVLLCHRIAEAVSEFPEDTPLEEREVTVELPLIGNLTIKPEQFHSEHRLTGKPSTHLEFIFKPLSGFKSDVMKSFFSGTSPLAEAAADLYSDRLKYLYKCLKEEG